MTAAAPAPASKPDWERIEALYRAGILSVREIAASQGISHTAVQKRAKADGWERDLTARIKAKADSLVAKREVAKQVASETKVATDTAIVDANAQVIAGIRLAHRSDIARSRALAMSLLGELEAETGNLELFGQLAELLTSEDGKAHGKRLELFNKVISGATRVDSMKKLAETLRTLVGLEREAYGLTVDMGGEIGRAPTGLSHFYGES